jgi:hypothetical protein
MWFRHYQQPWIKRYFLTALMVWKTLSIGPSWCNGCYTGMLVPSASIRVLSWLHLLSKYAGMIPYALGDVILPTQQ